MDFFTRCSIINIRNQLNTEIINYGYVLNETNTEKHNYDSSIIYYYIESKETKEKIYRIGIGIDKQFPLGFINYIYNKQILDVYDTENFTFKLKYDVGILKNIIECLKKEFYNVKVNEYNNISILYKKYIIQIQIFYNSFTIVIIKKANEKRKLYYNIKYIRVVKTLSELVKAIISDFPKLKKKWYNFSI